MLTCENWNGVYIANEAGGSPRWRFVQSWEIWVSWMHSPLKCTVDSEKYLEALSPSPSSNVYFAFVNSLIDEPDLDALGRMYAQYIRKNPKVVKVGFHCTQYCYRDSESDLRDYLWNLTRDNAWIGFIRKNPAAILRSLLQGRKSPTVLYFALRQRISELEEYY